MGEVFAGRYELVDPIGRGGVGAVWRAWDQRRRRYVAAKVLQQSDAHTLLRFVREQALRIDHPHVLAPASWAADDDKVLFTMDLVGGGSFAHLIGDYGPLPPRYVCTLLDQLLSGLAAVHAEGVVHRDIKPANILLEATGTGRPHVRLSDFGIALTKGEPRLTEADFVMGTPGYFAPEQMQGAEPDFPADLFAVGLVALYLISGRKPDADAIVRRFEEHGVPGAPEGVPEPLWQVIANLLQPDPEDRFRTATGARKALAEAVELLPEPDLDDEAIEVFDHLGPLPAGFGPDGPERKPRRSHRKPGAPSSPAPSSGSSGSSEATTVAPVPSMSDTGSFQLPPPLPEGPRDGVEPGAPGPYTPPETGRGQPETPGRPGTYGQSDQPYGQRARPEDADRQGPAVPLPYRYGSGAGPAPDRPAPYRPHADGPGPGPGGRDAYGTTARPEAAPGPGRPVGPPTPAGASPPVPPGPPTPTPSFTPPPFGPPIPPTPTPTPTPSLTGTPTPPGYGNAPTRPYTAPQPAPRPAPQPAPAARPSASAAPQRAARPGPPAKVAVPVLLLALLCFAVGAWAFMASG
ncbi:serine/threonine-protein kinase [Streptomyces sp. P1-3]|uniref:serine/threonine-protein kinase n=1 Tax=Streptomyces sp. P1-3 TaxID=3421658 RepID=UPI003D36D439